MSLILDSTLRDGAYAFGNSMPRAYVESIASNLNSLVDFIEVGSPVSFGFGQESALYDDLVRLSILNQSLTCAKSAIFIA